ANWFAPAGVTPETEYSFGRQNWFRHAAAEHRAAREAVGVFDQTSFGKLLVDGPDASAALQRLCANDLDVSMGRLVYTGMLNERGGYESDLTVTRLAPAPPPPLPVSAQTTRDASWVRRNLFDGARVSVRDVTAAW